MLEGTARQVAAEFLGTFVLILFGDAVVAQVVFGGGDTGDFFAINLAWGLAVTMGVYVAGGVSGAHLNPAVTLAMAVLRGFAWRKVLPYMAAQLAGAFVASAVVYATYHEALNEYDGGDRQVIGAKATAGIWATYPRADEMGHTFLSNVPGGLVDQVVGTGLLLLCIFALTDGRNTPPVAWFGPVAVGSVVLLIGLTFGYNCGYAINPARDLGPRLFTAVAGWGSEVFTAYDYWFWVPLAGPLIGGVLGGWVYDLFVARHHPKEAGES